MLDLPQVNRGLIPSTANFASELSQKLPNAFGGDSAQSPVSDPEIKLFSSQNRNFQLPTRFLRVIFCDAHYAMQ